MPLRRYVPRGDARVRKRHLLDARGGASLHAHRDFERRLCIVCVSFSCVFPSPSVRADVRQRRRYRSEFLEGLARAPHRDHPDAEVVAANAAAVVVFVASPRSRRRRQKRRARRVGSGQPRRFSVLGTRVGFVRFFRFSETNIAPAPAPAPEGVDAGVARLLFEKRAVRRRVAGERVHFGPQRLGVRLKRVRVHPGRAGHRGEVGAPVRAHGTQECGHVGHAVFGPGDGRGRSPAERAARGVHDDDD